MLRASVFFIDTTHRPVATADDVIPPVLIDGRGEASRAERERHTVRWPSLKRSWRRGNGFEPPSRAVHTRALPIELPCRLWTLRRGWGLPLSQGSAPRTALGGRTFNHIRFQPEGSGMKQREFLES